MTVNELIALLEKVRDAGHGEKDVFTTEGRSEMDEVRCAVDVYICPSDGSVNIEVA